MERVAVVTEVDRMGCALSDEEGDKKEEENSSTKKKRSRRNSPLEPYTDADQRDQSEKFFTALIVTIFIQWIRTGNSRRAEFKSSADGPPTRTRRRLVSFFFGFLLVPSCLPSSWSGLCLDKSYSNADLRQDPHG